MKMLRGSVLKPLGLWPLIGVVFLAGPAVVMSQESTAGRQETLEEIVVTAARRSEPLQTVPLSITAIGQMELEERGAKDFQDFARSVPGVSFTGAGHGQSRIVIRGINATGGAETVGFYLDDTPVSAGTSDFVGYADPKLFDIARVEVLRGPQGTLYGSSSMGGTIRLISNKPNLKAFEARTLLELSSTREATTPGYEGQFVAERPLS